MVDFAAAQLHPPTTGRVSNRRAALSWTALAAFMYLASAAVVRLFDYLIVRAQMAQLAEEAGPTYSVACGGCMSTPVLTLVWLSDWRALLVWSLIAGGAAAAVLISRGRPTP